MVQRTVLNTSGKTIDERALDSLIGSVRGEVIRTGDPGYDEVRKVWNAMIDKRPGVILRCSGVADVTRPSVLPESMSSWCPSVEAGITWLAWLFAMTAF